jgi:hypothetical protein
MLIVAVGGYWAVLQSVAWVGMAIAYSQEASIGEALKKTFDGQHPCKLCLAVKKGKQAERKHDTLKIQTKLDFVCLQLATFLSPDFPSTLLFFSDEFAGARSETPPTPPPRRA